MHIWRCPGTTPRQGWYLTAACTLRLCAAHEVALQPCAHAKSMHRNYSEGAWAMTLTGESIVGSRHPSKTGCENNWPSSHHSSSHRGSCEGHNDFCELQCSCSLQQVWGTARTGLFVSGAYLIGPPPPPRRGCACDFASIKLRPKALTPCLRAMAERCKATPAQLGCSSRPGSIERCEMCQICYRAASGLQCSSSPSSRMDAGQFLECVDLREDNRTSPACKTAEGSAGQSQLAQGVWGLQIPKSCHTLQSLQQNEWQVGAQTCVEQAQPAALST
jgi:hypothetical protein